MDGRLWPQQRLKPGQTHDDGLDEGDVAETLQSLDQNPQKVLDVVIGDGFGDLTKDHQTSRLERRVVSAKRFHCQVFYEI